MCNPVRTFECVVRDALRDPQLEVLRYVEPTVDRATVEPVPMPLTVLKAAEREIVRASIGDEAYAAAEANGLSEAHRMALGLRDTDHAAPQGDSYRRGAR